MKMHPKRMCPSCDRQYFTPTPLCPDCLMEQLDKVDTDAMTGNGFHSIIDDICRTGYAHLIHAPTPFPPEFNDTLEAVRSGVITHDDVKFLATCSIKWN